MNLTICNTCKGTGTVKGLHNWLSGGTREEACWNCSPAPAPVVPAVDLEEVLRERDEAEDFSDALLDEVLGHERPEWSSAYGRDHALSDVRERITALHKPAVDKAWDQFQSAMAVPQQAAVDERASFETWYAKWHGVALTRRTAHPAIYMSDDVNAAWKGWQARAALAEQGDRL